jgi:NADH dehydrogenase/NADH:ubiquinone oxidoreductase subunit G
MDLLLKRVINVKTVVTQRWKDETQQAMQGQINEVDSQLQQLEMQGQQAIAAVKQQSLQPPGPQVMQQIESIQVQVNEQKSQLLEQKNGVLQQLQQVQFLELNQEVGITQLDSTFAVQVGDNLIEKMNTEVLLRDGIVMEIRGII